MLIQTNCNIEVRCNIISKAINIQKINSDISSFLILNSNSTRVKYLKNELKGVAKLEANINKIYNINSNLNCTSNLNLTNVKTYSTTRINIKSNSNLECYRFDRDIKNSLSLYIPTFLARSKVFEELLRVQSNEITRNNALLKDLEAQLYLETATWGLDYWEEDLGIETNKDLSYKQRREKIKFRKQLPNTIITKKFFKKVMDNYYISDIYEDFNSSKVNITIKGIRGIPPKINEMISDAKELLPAHLIYEFIYTYLPWNEVDAANITWNELESYSWDKLEITFL